MIYFSSVTFRTGRNWVYKCFMRNDKTRVLALKGSALLDIAYKGSYVCRRDGRRRSFVLSS